ncbi:hypothetical protein RI367_005098 [Sorochytrium milnesiophthora]
MTAVDVPVTNAPVANAPAADTVATDAPDHLLPYVVPASQPAKPAGALVLPNGKFVDGTPAYLALCVGSLWGFIESCLFIVALNELSSLENMMVDDVQWREDEDHWSSSSGSSWGSSSGSNWDSSSSCDWGSSSSSNWGCSSASSASVSFSSRSNLSFGFTSSSFDSVDEVHLAFAWLRQLIRCCLAAYILMTLANLVSISMFRGARAASISGWNSAQLLLLLISTGLYIYVWSVAKFNFRTFAFLLFEYIVVIVCWGYPQKMTKLMEDPAPEMTGVVPVAHSGVATSDLVLPTAEPSLYMAQSVAPVTEPAVLAPEPAVLRSESANAV